MQEQEQSKDKTVEDKRTEPGCGLVKSKDFLKVCSPQQTAEPMSQSEPVAASLSLSLAVVTAAAAATAVTAIVSAPAAATFSTPSSSSSSSTSSSPSSRMSTTSPGAHQLSSPMIVESALPLGSDGDGAESVITRHLLPIAPLSPVTVAAVDSEAEVVHIRISPNRSNKSNDSIQSLPPPPPPPRPSSSSSSPSLPPSPPFLLHSSSTATASTIITTTTTSTSLPTVPKVSVRNDLTHPTVVDYASAEVRPYIKIFLLVFTLKTIYEQTTKCVTQDAHGQTQRLAFSLFFLVTTMTKTCAHTNIHHRYYRFAMFDVIRCIYILLYVVVGWSLSFPYWSLTLDLLFTHSCQNPIGIGSYNCNSRLLATPLLLLLLLTPC